jgi:hypothetical protein
VFGWIGDFWKCWLVSGFWVVYPLGNLCRNFGVGFPKVGPTGPPGIPGWNPGRVLSTWYQSIRLIIPVDLSKALYLEYLIYLASTE